MLFLCRPKTISLPTWNQDQVAVQWRLIWPPLHHYEQYISWIWRARLMRVVFWHASQFHAALAPLPAVVTLEQWIAPSTSPPINCALLSPLSYPHQTNGTLSYPFFSFWGVVTSNSYNSLPAGSCVVHTFVELNWVYYQTGHPWLCHFANFIVWLPNANSTSHNPFLVQFVSANNLLA